MFWSLADPDPQHCLTPIFQTNFGLLVLDLGRGVCPIFCTLLELIIIILFESRMPYPYKQNPLKEG
jgi:hypothetical protein